MAYRIVGISRDANNDNTCAHVYNNMYNILFGTDLMGT